MEEICRGRIQKLQRRIYKCDECKGDIELWKEQVIPEHGLSSKWGWWFRNKFPCQADVGYVFFRYDGRSEYVFVALCPSTVWVFDTADFFLANALKACGLVREVFKLEGDSFVFYEGCFVTDLIKCRRKARDVGKSVPSRCLHFLREELEMVRACSGKEPKVIAIGKGTRDILWRYRNKLGIRSWNRFKRKEEAPRIYFHSYAEWRGEKKDVKRRKTFEKYVKDIKKEMKKFGNRNLQVLH